MPAYFIAHVKVTDAEAFMIFNMIAKNSSSLISTGSNI